MSASVRTHGKVILAGEHGVVRGGEALVFPLRSRSLELTWAPSTDGKFHVSSLLAGAESENGDNPFGEPFRLALERALGLSGFKLPHSGYAISIQSDIPIQAGLGSSAALSVAVVRFLMSEGANLSQPFTLALEIENLFHGKSSGIDVASVLSNVPIRYSRDAPPQDLRMAWRPSLYLKDTGKRSSTKECVARVEAVGRKDLDERMAKAVTVALSALASEQADRLNELTEAMEIAASCFSEWGLGPDPSFVLGLKQKGALSVKPTGSGGGGFVLTLWREPPPKDLGLIPIWEGSSKGP